MSGPSTVALVVIVALVVDSIVLFLGLIGMLVRRTGDEREISFREAMRRPNAGYANALAWGWARIPRGVTYLAVLALPPLMGLVIVLT